LRMEGEGIYTGLGWESRVCSSILLKIKDPWLNWEDENDDDLQAESNENRKQRLWLW
jgi:hypothetical protein